MHKKNQKAETKQKETVKRPKKAEIPQNVLNEILSKVKVSYTITEVGSYIHPDVAARLNEEKKKREQD